MSGDGPSRTPRQKVDGFSEDLEAYARIRGLLPPDPHAARVAGYLSMTPDDYDELSKDGLSKIALDVTQFAHRVQSEVNTQKVKASRCRHRITRMTEPRLGNYDRFKTEDKRLAAIMDDDAALEYYDVQANCEAFCTRFEGEVARLDAYVKAIGNRIYNA